MGGARAGRTVLVVDDHASLRLLCRVNLELEGHRVLEAATLAAARDHLAREEVDVVLLDVHVGDDDGLAFLLELRGWRPGIPVALLTGSAELTGRSGELADGVLRKPFSLEELSEAVQRLTAP